MKILLAAINAKYIHSNPAVYDLKAYAEAHCAAFLKVDTNISLKPTSNGNGTSPAMHNINTPASGYYDFNTASPNSSNMSDIATTSSACINTSDCNNKIIEIAEYTINNRAEACLADIYKRQPDVVAFSCYIWNWSFIKCILKDIKKILPNTILWLGGPEVSYHAEAVLDEFPDVEGIMIGEGEETFTELCRYYFNEFAISELQSDKPLNPDVYKTISESTPGGLSTIYSKDSVLNTTQPSDLPKEKSDMFDAFTTHAPYEKVFSKANENLSSLYEIPGLCIRKDGTPYFTGERKPINMDDLPFWYSTLCDFPSLCANSAYDFHHKNALSQHLTAPNSCQNKFNTICKVFSNEHYTNLDTLKNRIVYYESSRGCPFGCSYCLSSVDKSVRYRSLDLVLPELQFFLDNQVPQVKFIDRTFNCNHKRTEVIWKYITEHDNGITNFHFELSADLLSDGEIELLSKMRPGLVQLEIGVQSSNPETLTAVHRKADLTRLKEVVSKIKVKQNVHVHLDLIAGLPYEDFSNFKNSFRDVFLMNPDQLQLGFLKVLKGSPIEDEAETYEIKYMTEPPYEVLSTRWIAYEEILKLKAVEEMLETFYNSHQFENTVNYMLRLFENPFELFEKLAEFYEAKGYNVNTPSRMDRFNVLLNFASGLDPSSRETYKELLTYDAYLRENCKSRPAFALDLSEYNDIIYPTQKGKKLHVDVFNYSVWDGANVARLEKPTLVTFDYENRNPLSNNCQTQILT